MKIRNSKLEINPDNLHHGYLIVGDREGSKNTLMQFLADELDVTMVGNPDFSFSEYNTVGIDEARALAEVQGRMGFGGEGNSHKAPGTSYGKKVFVISTNIITDEAQNALLKVFEEPTAGTHFFILVSQNTFLPTFLSRLVLIQAQDVKQETSEVLRIPIAERLAMVTKLAGEISDEKKVKQDAIDLVNQIERELLEDGGVEKHAEALRECAFARTALFSRGAMIKMVLENLILQI